MAISESQEEDLIRHYTFSEPDLAVIRQRYRPANRLGFAIQLCYMRYPGVTLRLARRAGGGEVSAELHDIEPAVAPATVLPPASAGPRGERLLRVKGAGAGWRAAAMYSKND